MHVSGTRLSPGNLRRCARSLSYKFYLSVSRQTSPWPLKSVRLRGSFQPLCSPCGYTDHPVSHLLRRSGCRLSSHSSIPPHSSPNARQTLYTDPRYNTSQRTSSSPQDKVSFPATFLSKANNPHSPCAISKSCRRPALFPSQLHCSPS